MAYSQFAVIAFFIIGVPAIVFSLVRTWRTFFNRTIVDGERRALTFVYMFHAALISAVLFLAVFVVEYERGSSSEFVDWATVLLAITTGLPILYLVALYCRRFLESGDQKRRVSNR